MRIVLYVTNHDARDPLRFAPGKATVSGYQAFRLLSDTPWQIGSCNQVLNAETNLNPFLSGRWNTSVNDGPFTRSAAAGAGSQVNGHDRIASTAIRNLAMGRNHS